MKTVGDLLRSADPLGHEAIWSPLERLTVQQRVLADPPVLSSEWSRRSLIMSVATACVMLITGVAVGPRFFSSSLQAAVRLEVRLAEESPAPGLEAAILSTGRTIYLHRGVVVTNEDIAEARVVPGNSPSTFGVDITLSTRGAEKMSRASSNHVGKLVAIFMNGQIVATPILRGPISKLAVISGLYTRAEADRLADGMMGR